MKHSHSARRVVATAAALLAIGAMAFAATGCSKASTSVPAATAPVAAPQAADAAAAATAPAAASSAPTAAQGQQVLQTRCTGKCHGGNLLSRRYPAAKAQAIAADMGNTAGLNSAQKAAVVAYFAQ